MSSQEDELAQAFIRHHRDSQERENQYNPEAGDVGVYPEAHYNHYGTRGVVDLYLSTGEWDGHLLEFKSEAAVRNVTGANEVIRQFNQMRQYFFDGSQHNLPTQSLLFELCFTPSERNIRNLAENAELYASVVEQEFVELPSGTPQTHITVRGPEDITPVTFFNWSMDFRDGVKDWSFTEYVEMQRPELFAQFERVFQEISTQTQ